jgi:ADP-ribose pyrophosphatase YjhB (NUDIX family)
VKKQTKENQKVSPPKICYTVSGCLIVDEKILLVKHRKAGFWLKPGGHIEQNELPHHAAEREFFEETGIKVNVAQHGFLPSVHNDQFEFLPTPFACNLHWVSNENYQKRITSQNPEERTTDGVWERGCEQHCHMDFLLEPCGDSLTHTVDPEESLDIGWFTLEEIKDLETTEDIRNEIQYAFKIKDNYVSTPQDPEPARGGR